MEGETARGVAQRECVEQATVAHETRIGKAVDPVRAELLAKLAVFAGDLRLARAIEAVVAVAAACVIGCVVTDAGGQNRPCGLCALVLDGHADEVHRRTYRLAFLNALCRGKHGEVVNQPIALKLVVNDGQFPFFERADAHAGWLKFRPGKEHELAEAGAQVAFGSHLSGRLGIHHSQFIRRMREVRERLAGAVDGRVDHLGGGGGGKQQSAGRGECEQLAGDSHSSRKPTSSGGIAAAATFRDAPGDGSPKHANIIVPADMNWNPVATADERQW